MDLLKIAKFLIDYLKELVETFDLTNGYFRKVNISWVAKYLCEEILPFFFIKQEQILLLVSTYSNLSMLVDPLEEETLIGVEVWLLHKQLP